MTRHLPSEGSNNETTEARRQSVARQIASNNRRIQANWMLIAGGTVVGAYSGIEHGPQSGAIGLLAGFGAVAVGAIANGRFGADTRQLKVEAAQHERLGNLEQVIAMPTVNSNFWKTGDTMRRDAAELLFQGAQLKGIMDPKSQAGRQFAAIKHIFTVMYEQPDIGTSPADRILQYGIQMASEINGTLAECEFVTDRLQILDSYLPYGNDRRGWVHFIADIATDDSYRTRLQAHALPFDRALLTQFADLC